MEWYWILTIVLGSILLLLLLSVFLYKPFFKRFWDIVCSLMVFLLLWPLWLFLAILVRIKLGSPIYFKQVRPGKNGKLFKLIKFRTMTDEKDENGNLLPDEVRLTKFGKWLRKTSLDEMPEAINIFLGHMSVIGPRPLLVKDYVFFDDNILKRQSVRPGLSGLAQVKGRNNISWEDKFKYDLEYCKNVSLFKDFSLVVQTIIKAFFKHDDIDRKGFATDEDYGDYLLRKKNIDTTTYSKKMEDCGTYIESCKEVDIVETSTRNRSIDIYRVICAILVVFLHTHLFEDVNSNLFVFVSKFFASVAVPFFISVSGMYFYKKIQNSKNYFKYLLRLVAMYSFWSLLYFIILFIRNGGENLQTFFTTALLDFFLRGEYYHLWFFPAVIINSFLLFIFHIIKCDKIWFVFSIALYIFGTLGTTYYSLGIQIPFIGGFYDWEYFIIIRRILFMTPLLFNFGYLLNCLNKIKNNRTILLFLTASWGLFIVEGMTISLLHLSNSYTMCISLVPLTFLTIIYLLRHPLYSNAFMAQYTVIFASLTYLIHPLFIDIVSSLYFRCFSCEPSQSLSTSIVLLMCVASSLLLTLYFSHNKKSYLRKVI